MKSEVLLSAGLSLALLAGSAPRAQEASAGAQAAESSGAPQPTSVPSMAPEGAAPTERGNAPPPPQSAADASPTVPPPLDVRWPGVIHLQVDATDLPHAIFQVRESVPVRGGAPLTLLYPKWIPGEHSPGGPIDKVAGLVITANGNRVAWKRDPVDVNAFQIVPPPGATSLDVSFQYLSAVSSREGRVSVTPDMLDVKWNTVVLYPAGVFARDVIVEPRLRLPAGFRAATALEPTGPGRGDETAYRAVPLDVLVDSPVMAGRNFVSFDLDPGGPAKVTLDVIADRPDQLDDAAAHIAPHRELVRQAARLFGSHQYAHYDFLLWLSDRMTREGLEHHQSSEDGTQPNYFKKWKTMAASRDLLPHEYTHSWNGKFRRPADLWTPNYDVPMRDSLLWVYEGQTQYWGHVLAARSGLVSRQEALDRLALSAATYEARVGRVWRPLEDTTNDPVIAARRPLSWPSWQRSEDYYEEGALVWLDADTLIRERTHGARSLDDFARAFFGVDNGSYAEVTYKFEDIVAALNAVLPYDWAGFLHERLEGLATSAPLDGVARGGYRLVFTPDESDYQKDAETQSKVTDFTFSLGLAVGKEGVLTNVQWDGPAFKAGLTADDTLVAVNGGAYDVDLLKDAVRDAAKPNAPAMTLLVKDKDSFRTVTIDYHGGPRYPHLERTGAGPASLDAILTPRAS